MRGELGLPIERDLHVVPTNAIAAYDEARDLIRVYGAFLLSFCLDPSAIKRSWVCSSRSRATPSRVMPANSFVKAGSNSNFLGNRTS
jgi:hypothetical protein